MELVKANVSTSMSVWKEPFIQLMVYRSHRIVAKTLSALIRMAVIIVHVKPAMKVIHMSIVLISMNAKIRIKIFSTIL